MQAFFSALTALTRAIDAANEHIGRVASWLALGMVLLQFILPFSYGG